MRRTVIRSMLGVVIVAAVAATVAVVLSATTRAQETRTAAEGGRGGEVVMLQCRVASGSITVSSYQASTEAPAKRTDSCSQTLSELMRNGFTIQHQGLSQEATYAFYMLLR